MNRKLICILTILLLLSINIAACSKRGDNTIGQNQITSQNQTTANDPKGSQQQAQINNWFPDSTLSNFGANGIIPPGNGYVIDSVNENKARFSNASEGTYKQYVYDSYSQLKNNNEKLYTLVPGSNTFSLANIPDSSGVVAGSNVYYYRIGNSIYSVSFGYNTGLTQILNTVDMRFDDVTDKYKNYNFEK